MKHAGTFWARRRVAVEAEERAAAEAAQRRADEHQANALEEMDDAEALEHLGLPDPETLGAGDDFSGFMRSGVPEKFRRVALRRLWRSNPVLACVDGLNDYDEDFRAQATGQVVKTAYQVGRGMLAHLEHIQPKEDDTGTVEADDHIAAVHAVDAVDEDAVEETAMDTTAPARAPEPEIAQEEPESDSPMPRRMRFHFEEVNT